MAITQQTPPDFTCAEIKKIARHHFGVSTKAKNLDSDIGQNFLLMEKDKPAFIFKVSNPEEKFTDLQAQNQMMDRLATAELEAAFPRALPALNGKQIVPLPVENGAVFNGRMLSFIDGDFLAHTENHSEALLHSFGEVLGKMDAALQGFDHPALHRYWHWDLKNALDLRRYFASIETPRSRTLAAYWLQQFENEAVPLLPNLRQSVIHNDANDHNVLVGPEGRLCGLIDFGDAVFSCTVFELAIALAYVMMDKDDPLAAAVPVVRGYHAMFPLQEIELKILFFLIAARLVSSVTISAFQQQQRPENKYLSISAKPAWALLERFVAINPFAAETAFREACEMTAPASGLANDEILALREKHTGKSLSISYSDPLKIVRGSMQYLHAANGRTYLDCVNNVCHVGHCHPRVVAAGQEQMARLNTNTRYLHDHLARYAERLTALFPSPLEVCFLVNSGSEANELAIRLARTYTGKKDFIVLEHAYHGNTSSVVELSPYKFDGPGGSGCPAHIHKAPIADVYRGQWRADDADAAQKYAGELQKTIEKMQEDERGLAGFFCESLPGVAGQIVFPEGYMQKAFNFVRAAGGLCIADEVQIGFGRVGSHFWGFETQGALPDIVTLGKPMGNGHPLGAVVTTREIANAFANGMEYFNTFGGNPVSCAIGLAVLEVIEEEKLCENAATVGAHFLAELKKLQAKYTLIGDVRGRGLYLGIELVKNRETRNPAATETKGISEAMKERGILISVDGPLYNVLKIKPPIVFTRENADRVVENLDAVLREI